MGHRAGPDHLDGAGAGEVLLEYAGIGKEYGGLTVLDEVKLTLPPQGLSGLCGPNGADKPKLGK